MTLYNRIFIFFIMMFAPIISCFADTEIKLSDEESQAMFQLIKSLEPNKPITLELTQPQNEKGYIALLKSHGITEQNNPDIFENIKTMKASKKVIFDQGESLDISNSSTEPTNHFGNPRIVFSEDSKLVSAQVLSSIYFPPLTTLSNDTIKTNAQQISVQGTLSILGKDKNGKRRTILVPKHGKAINTEVRNFSIGTEKYNLAELDSIQTVASFQGKKSGKPLTSGPVLIVSNTLTNLEDLAQYYQPATMENQAPTYVKNLPTDDSPIIVCLNRANPESGTPSQCDYGPTSPGNPTIKLEIIGNVTFNNPIKIDTIGKSKNDKGEKSQVDLTLVGLDTGGACKLAKNINEDTFWKHTKVNDDPDKGNNTNLSWDFSKNTGYADFGSICWRNNERYILDLQATIITMQGDNAFAVPFSYTNAPHARDNPSQFIYPPIHIQYGCIAEGTLIDMANGSKWKVENIRPGDKVLTKQGGILQVKSRIVGHDTEFIDLIYNNGEQVSLTPTHPVSTLRGIVKADELKIGDTIHTREGQTTLTSVKQRKSEPSNVYNFVLEKTDSQNELLPEDAVLFAGGILVGDNNLQRKVSISN
uniref:Hint domain-containing protein n=1 Tax=Photorhabdus sp. RM322S TaxID=3342825 RepID=UPI0036DBFB85